MKHIPDSVIKDIICICENCNDVSNSYVNEVKEILKTKGYLFDGEDKACQSALEEIIKQKDKEIAKLNKYRIELKEVSRLIMNLYFMFFPLDKSWGANNINVLHEIINEVKKSNQKEYIDKNAALIGSTINNDITDTNAALIGKQFYQGEKHEPKEY